MHTITGIELKKKKVTAIFWPDGLGSLGHLYSHAEEIKIGGSESGNVQHT